MTSQSPRIYLYKITFEEVLYYYYGVHKEKKFGEYYMGSPKTHKWCWEFYTLQEGRVPNRFVRFMMYLCFDCKWVKKDT